VVRENGGHVNVVGADVRDDQERCAASTESSLSEVGGSGLDGFVFFFSSRRRHTRCSRDWSSDVCSSDLAFLLIKKRKITFKNYYYLSKKNDLKQAAKNLYSLLRSIKKDGYKMIAVEKIPNIGIGKTLNDRLNRASKF